MKRNKRGFTLVEVVVVIAVLAILAAVAVPTSFGMMSGVEKRQCQSSTDALYTRWLMQQKMNGSAQTLDDFLKPYNEKTVPKASEDYVEPCPAGGTYTAVYENTVAVSVHCSVHDGQKASEWLDTYRGKANALLSLKVGESCVINGVKFTRTDTQTVVSDDGKYTLNVSKTGNTDTVRLLYEMLGYRWPTMQQNGTTFSLIPYTAQKGGVATSLVYATKGDISGEDKKNGCWGGWSASYIYFDNQWYQSNGSNVNIAGLHDDSPAQVLAFLQDTTKFTPVDLDFVPPEGF